MYAGHFAVGLAIKSARPRMPTWPLLIGVGLLDIVDGVLVATGLERVTPDPKAGPYLYFDLTFIDWDHSLLMAAVLALAWGALFLSDRMVAVAAALAVFSHFIADWPVHNHDLALYPYSIAHLGGGLWGRLGTGAWLLEGAFAALLSVWAWRRAQARGTDWRYPLIALALLFLQLSPWTSPMKWIATRLPAPSADTVHGILVAVGFLVPAILLTVLVDRAERRGHSSPIATPAH